MIFTPIYIAMTFIKSWRIRSLRSRLSEFLIGSRGVRFYETPDTGDSPTLCSKPITNPDNQLCACNYINVKDTKRVCNMDIRKRIDLTDWIACVMGMPLGMKESIVSSNLDIEILLECAMEPLSTSTDHSIISLEALGHPVAWKAGSNLSIVLITNIENLSLIGYNYLGGDLIVNHKLPVTSIETVRICGEPNKATDLSLRAPRNRIKTSLKWSGKMFEWSIHASLLRKLTNAVEVRSSNIESEIPDLQNSNIHEIVSIEPDVRSAIPIVTTQVNGHIKSEQNSFINSSQEIQEQIIQPNASVSEQTIPDKQMEVKRKVSNEYINNIPINSTTISNENTLQGSSEKFVEVNKQQDSCKFDIKVPEDNNLNDSEIKVKESVDQISSIKADIESQIISNKSMKTESKSPNKSPKKSTDHKDKLGGTEVVLENVIQIQHNISPKKNNLNLDLKKGSGHKSTSLLNFTSQIQSVTTHKRIVSTTVPKKAESQTEMVQSKHDPPTLKGLRGSRPLVNTKSPNVLIYSDSVVARDNLEATLKKVLDCDRYTVQCVSEAALTSGAWRGRAALVAVAGHAGAGGPLLLAHLLSGGRLLALCSDLLHTVLPHYKTAEIRENEIVQFSYDKWKSVKMKHHIFCYQASPAKKQFSTESDRQASVEANTCWQTRYSGHPGHELEVQVLASEETWRTPSLLQATDLTNKGVAIFSQVHLETDPSNYLDDEGAQSNEARIEILHKILGDILGMHVKDQRDLPRVNFTRGYFLGDHVQKMALLEKWCQPVNNKRIQKLGDMTIQWCVRDETPIEQPSENFLPVYLFDCPENFSTVVYFENLTSKHLGRQVIYADVASSTIRMLGAPLAHGVAAVARRQVAGRGRGGNSWITVPGQASVSLQVWQKVSPWLPLVQHAAALAAVAAVRCDSPYAPLDIRIKWPNDIYYGRNVKIGGTIVTCNCMSEDVVIDIGTGVNISNKVPTTCVNEIISEYNSSHGTNLPPVTTEWFLARYCSRLEAILDELAREGGVQDFLDHYYKYWLHDGEEIQVQTAGGSSVAGKVVGLDPAGWLLVATEGGRQVPVSPDGNTFDIMAGLIAPKL